MNKKETILRLTLEGKSYRQIEKETGISKGLISYYLGDNQKHKTLERSNMNKAKLRREVWDIKEKSGCIDCKEMYPHYVLEFDHREGEEKLGSPSEIYSRGSREKGTKEMEKCDIVCANCHKIRTHNRAQNGIRKFL
jgi:NAD-dependent dihydropyrimidine dehydrogenase PreA subunit